MPHPTTRLLHRCLALLSLLGALAACGTSPAVAQADYRASPQFSAAEGRFRNPVAMPERSLAETAGLWWRNFFGKPEGTMPAQELPVQPLTRAEIDAAPDGSLWRLTHSTVLLKLQGRYWLTDPIFSERASPVQWAGPRRFHRNPIALAELPPIRAVILSHDHYDHLDHETILALVGKVELFVSPLGVGDRLREWGVAPERIRQLDWWQETEVDGVRLVATPAQHFSGRTLNDRNRTLWAGWAILGREARVFFSGDTGYHPAFKAIGERLGPFDVTLMEVGAYDAMWPLVHMFPEQAVQAHLDLRGRRMVSVHNGSFDLGMHRWQEPVERAAAAAKRLEVDLLVPKFGERFDARGARATAPPPQ